MVKLSKNVKIGIVVVVGIVIIVLSVYFSMRCPFKPIVGECNYGCHCKGKKKGYYCNTVYNKCIPESKCGLLTKKRYNKTCRAYIL
jgi:hypothetical protein